MKFRAKVGNEFQGIEFEITESKADWKKPIAYATIALVALMVAIPAGYGMATGDYSRLQSLGKYFKEILVIIVHRDTG